MVLVVLEILATIRRHIITIVHLAHPVPTIRPVLAAVHSEAVEEAASQAEVEAVVSQVAVHREVAYVLLVEVIMEVDADKFILTQSALNLTSTHLNISINYE